MIMFKFILPVVFGSVSDFLSNIPGYYETIMNKYSELPEDSVIKNNIIDEVTKMIQNINIRQYFEINKIIEYLMGALNAVTSIFEVFVAIIVSIYILLERTQIINFIKKFINAIFKEN